MPEPRRSIPEHTELALKQFYGPGKSCIVCDVSRGAGVAWHHLDDNPARSEFVNVVPLCAGLNEEIESHRRNPARPLSGSLKEAALHARIDELFERAEFGRAFGVARVGAFLHWHGQADSDSVAMFAAQGLHNARALDRPDLAADIIERNVVNLFDDRVRAPVRLSMALLALEVACMFWDYGCFDSFRLWSRLCRRHLRGASGTKAAEIAHVRLEWKTAAAEVAANDPGAEDRLSRLRDELDSRTRYSGAVNVALWSARLAMKQRRLEEAESLLKPFLDAARIWQAGRGETLQGGHWWPIAESATTMAVVYRMWGRKARRDWLNIALLAFQAAGMRPTLVDGMYLPLLEYQRQNPVSADHVVSIRDSNKLLPFRQQTDELYSLLRRRRLHLA